MPATQPARSTRSQTLLSTPPPSPLSSLSRFPLIPPPFPPRSSTAPRTAISQPRGTLQSTYIPPSTTAISNSLQPVTNSAIFPFAFLVAKEDNRSSNSSFSPSTKINFRLERVYFVFHSRVKAKIYIYHVYTEEISNRFPLMTTKTQIKINLMNLIAT